MKKTTICITVLFLSLQYASAQISIMPEVGINLSNIGATDNSGGTTESYKNKIGWKAGASVILPISKSFFVQPGVFLSSKGTRSNYEESYFGFTQSYKYSFNTTNLEIPLNIGFINDLGKSGSLFLTAGPYLGFGLSGKYTYKEYLNGQMVPGTYQEAPAFGDSSNVKRFDFGVNLGIGYKLPFGVFLRAQYGTSLANLSKDPEGAVRNKGLSFSAGYIYTFKPNSKSKVKTGTDK